MPPKAKFTKEEIVSAALGIMREAGSEALSARNLAAKLGSSARPIFTAFDSMEQVTEAVISAAYEMYLECGRRNREDCGDIPVYKASGMAYIRFAAEEPNLFRLLFMRDCQGTARYRSSEFLEMKETVVKQTNFSSEVAERVHLEMWIFGHGIATMIVTGFLTFGEEQISEMLSDMYIGLCKRFGVGEDQ